jgi:hypothetical protein
MARLVDVANQLTHAAEDGSLQEEENHLTITESVIALRLTLPQLQEAWEAAQSKMGEMMGLL